MKLGVSLTSLKDFTGFWCSSCANLSFQFGFAISKLFGLLCPPSRNKVDHTFVIKLHKFFFFFLSSYFSGVLDFLIYICLFVITPSFFPILFIYVFIN